MQAGLLPPCKGGSDHLLGEVLAHRASAAATEPIGNDSEQRFAFGQGQGDDDEISQALNATSSIFSSPRSPKKRRIDEISMISLSAQGVTEMVEWAVDKALRDFASKQTRDILTSSVRNVRDEMEKTVEEMRSHMTQMMGEAMATMRAEAETRANAMLQTLLERVSGMIPGSVFSNSETDNRTRQATIQKVGNQTQNASQIPQVAKQTWAQRFGSGTQATSGWTTVSGRRKPSNTKTVLKKHPTDQRRILFARQSPTQQCDPRDIMLAINKALAREGADCTVRLVGLKYTKRGNLSGLTVEQACADDLLEYAATVLAAARTLDPAVASVEKTEKWRKLRVHGVSLDRYLCEGGLELAREEIESMTGESLPYAPRWIRSDGLEERFHSTSITRSSLVVTVKSKTAADTIMAKGLSFGGRRHEAEKFWMKGEGGICMHCCGRDHFGKCREAARCYVCADDHAGSEHRCQTESCGKKLMPCEHHAAKCTNCGGKHMATSPRCPEKWQKQQRRKNESTEQPDRPTEKDLGETLCPRSNSTAEEPARKEGSERPSELRSTPPMPETPSESSQAPTPEQNRNRLPLEMEVEMDIETPSPTPTQRRMTQFTISDDSFTA